MRALDRIEDVVRGADIAVGGTTSSDIMTREAWVKPGAVFISLARREFEPAGWARMDKVVIDSWEMNYLMPFFRQMVDGGVFTREQLHGEIHEVVAGTKPGRERAGGANPRSHHRPRVPGHRDLPLHFRAGEGEGARHHASRRPGGCLT